MCFATEFHVVVCGLDSILARRWMNGMLVSIITYCTRAFILMNIFWWFFLNERSCYSAQKLSYGIFDFALFCTFFLKKKCHFFVHKRAKSKIPYDNICGQQHNLSSKKIIKKYCEMPAELKFSCAHFWKQRLRTFWGFPRNRKSWKT